MELGLEKVAIIGMYCHLRPPDAIAFEASNLSCRRTQCAISFRVAVGSPADAGERVCDGLRQNKIVRVGKNPVRF